MNNFCSQTQDKMEDYVLEALGQQEMDVLQAHMNKCSECRKHAQKLEDQKRSLLHLAKAIHIRMKVGKDRAIEVLNNSIPTEQVGVGRSK
ncbi:MAG: anti-sigma factor family protein [Planctomycetota bacterium]|jgi:predicted anti-sigma-YlaC factor YlaD